MIRQPEKSYLIHHHLYILVHTCSSHFKSFHLEHAHLKISNFNTYAISRTRFELLFSWFQCHFLKIRSNFLIQYFRFLHCFAHPLHPLLPPPGWSLPHFVRNLPTPLLLHFPYQKLLLVQVLLLIHFLHFHFPSTHPPTPNWILHSPFPPLPSPLPFLLSFPLD